MFESYAQNGEDIVLWRTLRHIDNGTYVDVGAADPTDDSVTKAFYDRGWRGLNVEPAADYAELLTSARPRDVVVQACAGDADGSIVLHHVLGTGLSSVLDSAVDALADTSYDVVDVEVPVRRLDDILVEAGFTPDKPVHFLKIDVEGFEESVIRGIDLAIWRPWVIVAESTKPRSMEQAHHGWEPLLLARGYEFCLFDGLNRFYLAAEHSELRTFLSFPASVFDQPYQTQAHAQLMRTHHAVLESYDEQTVELKRTAAAYENLEKSHRDALESWNKLDSEHNRTVQSWNELDAEHNRMVQRWNELDAQQAELIVRCGDLEQQNRHAVEALAESALESATLRDGIAKMGREFDQMRDDVAAAAQELNLTHQTLSWRITRPLRRVRGLL